MQKCMCSAAKIIFSKSSISKRQNAAQTIFVSGSWFTPNTVECGGAEYRVVVLLAARHPCQLSVDARKFIILSVMGLRESGHLSCRVGGKPSVIKLR